MKNKVENKHESKQLNILAVISRFFCYMNIHKPIDKKFDSEYWYTNKSCKRCGCDVGFPKWKLNTLPKNDL